MVIEDPTSAQGFGGSDLISAAPETLMILT